MAHKVRINRNFSVSCWLKHYSAAAVEAYCKNNCLNFAGIGGKKDKKGKKLGKDKERVRKLQKYNFIVVDDYNLCDS